MKINLSKQFICKKDFNNQVKVGDIARILEIVLEGPGCGKQITVTPTILLQHFKEKRGK